MYAVGIDIGTTYTAAAVWRAGHAEIVPLGSHSAAIPTVVLLRSDGSFLTGESASRRGLSEPNRVAREFKRRLGDTTPILLGGTPYSAAALTARMLRSVVDAVSAREGGPPAAICVTHPANWGPYKIDRLREVVRLADLDQPVEFTTEPQAAASYHAQQQPLEAGAVVAVYDLGGGTFDAAVVRRGAEGFSLIGRPAGIDRLGGIDFDAAIFEHVAASVGAPLEQLDKDDPATVAAVARLREECVQAKEVLSADTDAVIQVLLPTVTAEVRLTRAELEAMVRPGILDSIEALRTEIRSAGYSPQALTSVLLVGGSSRMPIVAQLVGSELGRPVAVDANPKHAVALGAAWQAGNAIATDSPAPSTPAPANPVAAGATGSAPAETDNPGSAPAEPAAAGSTPGLVGLPTNPAPRDPDIESDEPTGEIPVVAALTNTVPGPGGPPPLPKATVSARVAIDSATEPGTATPAPAAFPTPPPTKADKRRLPVLVAAVAVLVLAAGGTAWALTRSNDQDDPTVQAAPTQQQSQATKVPSTPATSKPAAATGTPADELCTDEMKKSTRWVCITKATLHDNTFTVWYYAEWHGVRPNKVTGFHLHIYGGDGTDPDEATMGSQAVKHSKYYFEDQQPSVRQTSSTDFQAVGDAKKVCARIAQAGHGLAKAYDGSYHTGNCIPIERS